MTDGNEQTTSTTPASPPPAETAPATTPPGAPAESAATSAPAPVPTTTTPAPAPVVTTPAPVPATATASAQVTATTAPAPAPAPASVAVAPRAYAAPPPDLGTRLVGLGWLVLSALLVWFFAGQAFGSDLGTEKASSRMIIRALAVLVPAYPGGLGLVALITGRRPPLKWNLLSLPLEGWWFSTLWTLTWREIKGFYARPVAYIVLFLWLLINGWFMFILLDYYGGPESWGRDFQEPPSVYITSHWLAIVGLGFVAPALTMRLLAEESSTGSMEMLLTSPVTDAQVALSKYLGALTYFLAMLLSIGIYLVILRQYATEWDWGPVFAGYLGLFLLGAMFLSVGLFTSSVTDNQIVAFILALVPIMGVTFGVLLLKGVVTFDGARDIIDHVNIWELQAQFAKGVVQWRALAFYLSSTVFFLFLAVRGVESHTWR